MSIVIELERCQITKLKAKPGGRKINLPSTNETTTTDHNISNNNSPTERKRLSMTRLVIRKFMPVNFFKERDNDLRNQHVTLDADFLAGVTHQFGLSIRLNSPFF